MKNPPSDPVILTAQALGKDPTGRVSKLNRRNAQVFHAAADMRCKLEWREQAARDRLLKEWATVYREKTEQKAQKKVYCAEVACLKE